jgi:hypothetical protein
MNRIHKHDFKFANFDKGEVNCEAAAGHTMYKVTKVSNTFVQALSVHVMQENLHRLGWA